MRRQPVEDGMFDKQRASFLIPGILILLSLPLRGQQTFVPRYDIYGGYGFLNSPGIAHDPAAAAELRADAGAEELVVVHHEDADSRRDTGGRGHGARLGSRITTSVPAPGRLLMTALPPCRSMRPMIESAIPRRSAATASASKPAP